MIAESTIARAVRVHPAFPIFRLEAGEDAVFYTPGHVVTARGSQADQISAAIASGAGCHDSEADDLARSLEEAGRATVRTWHRQAERAYRPECLTLVLSNRCDLSCAYCFAAAHRTAQRPVIRPSRTDREQPAASSLLSVRAAEQAARLVARRCADLSRPLTVVFHGGGEPTLHWDLLRRLHAMAATVARDHGIGTRTYLATHGFIAESRARWLARHIDHIGLSCDGPPDIQDAQRPARGQPTSAVIERTARILASAGADLTVRATVTPATVRRQRDIVSYAHDRLGARRIRLEPVYRGRASAGPHFAAADADAFLAQFIQASETARTVGCDVTLSGARPDELHGPFCNPLRDVLQLTPDGHATACFLDTGHGDRAGAGLRVGRPADPPGPFAIDRHRAAELRRRAAQMPPRCEDCVNAYHCARDCPDVCLANAADAGEQTAGFRCRVQQGLTIWRILRMARGLPSD